MTDSLYRESVGYHEAGHVVVAAAQGMQVSREGIYLAVDGTGLACCRFRKPEKFYSGPSDISRAHTIIATYAGLIAQQKFYPDCSVQGGSDDQNLIDSPLARNRRRESISWMFSFNRSEV